MAALLTLISAALRVSATFDKPVINDLATIITLANREAEMPGAAAPDDRARPDPVPA